MIRSIARSGYEPCRALRNQEQQSKGAGAQTDELQPYGQPRQHVRVAAVITLQQTRDQEKSVKQFFVVPLVHGIN